MKYERIYVKKKIINHLVLNGKKETSERVLLKAFKELQKTSSRESKKLINVALIFSTPIFKIHKMVNKKKKKKKKKNGKKKKKKKSKRDSCDYPE